MPICKKTSRRSKNTSHRSKKESLNHSLLDYFVSETSIDSHQDGVKDISENSASKSAIGAPKRCKKNNKNNNVLKLNNNKNHKHTNNRKNNNNIVLKDKINCDTFVSNEDSIIICYDDEDQIVKASTNNNDLINNDLINNDTHDQSNHMNNLSRDNLTVSLNLNILNDIATSDTTDNRTTNTTNNKTTYPTDNKTTYPTNNNTTHTTDNNTTHTTDNNTTHTTPITNNNVNKKTTTTHKASTKLVTPLARGGKVRVVKMKKKNVRNIRRNVSANITPQYHDETPKLNCTPTKSHELQSTTLHLLPTTTSTTTTSPTTTATSPTTTSTTTTSSTTTTTSPTTTTTSPTTTTKSPTTSQTRMVDFFPVRRSNRTFTSKQIKQREEDEIEGLIVNATREVNGHDLKVVYIEGKGRGVVAGRRFSRGDFVVEYVGDLILMDEARDREDNYSDDVRHGCYMYYFKHADKQYCIDATAESDRLGRLLNHSRQHPNCHTKVFEVRGLPRLCLVACREIAEGTELLYDYGDRSKEALLHHPWLSL